MSKLEENKEKKSKKEKTSNKKEKTNKEKIKQEKNKNEVKETEQIKKKTNKSRIKRRKRKKSKKVFIIILIITLLLAIITSLVVFHNIKKNDELERQANLEKEITSHYNELVLVEKESKLYKLENEKYIESGKIGANQELTLKDINITYQTEYFEISTFEETYYIHYKDVSKIESLKEKSDRYKKYIPFNENIITKDTTNFYDESNNLVYTFNQSFNLPIIIKDTDKYGIEYNNQLLYINKEDVKEVKENNNTDKTNTKGIAVFNYHFFYDETKASERADCNQIICHPKSLFESHVKYIKDNEIFTPTMNEFEMYLDKKINLPKSVLITIDDGWRTAIAEEILEKNEVNATIFLITSWFEDVFFINAYKYIEYHSHGDDLHTQGICPGGQGGAIKCLERTKLLADLKLSREKLDGSTSFCYPFYEYNSYSIEVLKESGFTMAFRGGFKKATPGVNKYEIPRYVIYNNTSVSQIASYIN